MHPFIFSQILLAYSDKKALFEDVKMRRDELFEIEKVIRELGEMFVDLNNLVLSQVSGDSKMSGSVKQTAGLRCGILLLLHSSLLKNPVSCICCFKWDSVKLQSVNIFFFRFV